MDKVPKELQTQIDEGILLERKFADQLQAAKQTEILVKAYWKDIEEAMINNNIKSIKDESWGSLTIHEKQTFDIDKETLPARFFVKKPDETKIRNTYKLEKKLPKGVTLKELKQYLVRRIK